MFAVSVRLITDPAWPWSIRMIGLPALILVAALLVGLTLWTYLGVPQARGRRLIVVVTLRLLALFIGISTVLRPALAFRDSLQLPSVLILALDNSESMTIKDEFNDQTRWEAAVATVARCESILKRLQDEQNVTVIRQQFSADVADFDPRGRADGKRSEYGLMLASLRDRHGAEPNILGVLVVGDGIDNGGRPAIAEAVKWRGVAPIQCFAAGKATTNSQQKDVALTGVTTDPTPVFVKGKMTVRVAADAFGFEGQPIRVHVFIDDQEVPAEKIFVNDREITDGKPQLPLSSGNDLRLEVTAPGKPSEVRVTVRIEPFPGEVVTGNNEIATYVSVVKEGVSILYVDRLRPERKFIRQSLATDPRFRLFEVVRQTDDAPGPGESDLFQLDRQAYDVIIIGDVSARSMSAGNPKFLQKLRELVTEKGAGFMMLGGDYSFGGTPGVPDSGDWFNTPVSELLPVELAGPGHVAGPLEFHPTPRGERHYLLQLAGTSEESKEIWRRLNARHRLLGANRVARAKGSVANKPAAEVLATSGPNGEGEPLLVGQQVGKGRTLACAVDTTHRWREFGMPERFDGIDHHARFWKQAILWLAQQENTEGSVWLKADTRRLQAGNKQTFSTGIRGKNGIDLPGGTFNARVAAPDGTKTPVNLDRDGKIERGTFWNTAKAGEYTLEVSGKGVDTDGKAIEGNASIRFLVYQDETELLRQATDADFLGKLAASAGGRPKAYTLDDLQSFLQDLLNRSSSQPQSKTSYWPEWRKSRLTPFLPLWMVLFVMVLTLEWGCRRLWGMV